MPRDQIAMDSFGTGNEGLVRSSKSEVTTTTSLNLIRLLTAELEAGKHHDDATILVRAVDKQQDAASLPRTDVNNALADIANAKDLLGPDMRQVCDLAEAAKI